MIKKVNEFSSKEKNGWKIGKFRENEDFSKCKKWLSEILNEILASFSHQCVNYSNLHSLKFF